MKKILCLLLCAVMLCGLLVGCAGEIDIRKGAVIPVYISAPITTFDPAYAYLDDAAVSLLSLVYEGLFTVDQDGKVQNALAKEWSYAEEDGEYVMTIELEESAWSDGRSVGANDFIFAWKRILDPAFSSEAASMLYDIKNARRCKAGLCSIDDLGLYAPESNVLQITFESNINTDLFLEYLASPALVPLREDKVTRLDNWGSYYATIATNGPFFVKIFEPGTDEMVFERSQYYRRDVEDDRIDKYVTPFRFTVQFDKNASEQLELYNNGQIFYDGNLPLDQRAALAEDAETGSTFSTHTYLFNTGRAPFDNVDVRTALSAALDRSEIVKLVTFAEEASGFVPSPVFNTDRKTSFRETGGALISSQADLSEAKSLISRANPSVTSFTLTVRDDEITRRVAEYAVSVWEELGFEVEIVSLGVEDIFELDYNQYNDLFIDAYQAGDFDVIAIDSQALSTDAFPTLAAYAKSFSGRGIDVSQYAASESDDAIYGTHITGYDNSEYDELIESAYKEKDREERVELLHEAEKLLVADMPAAPLFTYQDAYLVSKDLKKVERDYFGGKIFDKVKLNDFEEKMSSLGIEK